MKKTIIIFTIILAIFIVGCTKPENTEDKNTPPPKPETSGIERNIMTVAEALAIDEEGVVTDYKVIGAIDGAKFSSSGVEIYQYNETVDEYKEIQKKSELSGMKVSAINNGFILVFINEEKPDLIKQFEDLKIKE